MKLQLNVIYRAGIVAKAMSQRKHEQALARFYFSHKKTLTACTMRVSYLNA